MHVETFAEIEAEFRARISRMILCNVATVDGQGRPRSRILHPVWEGSTGWIATRRHSPKSKQLDQNPYISLAYIGESDAPVYADCVATWVDDPAEKERVWNFILNTPPPLGYDPTPIFRRPDDPDFGALKLTPWQIHLDDPYHRDAKMWRQDVSALVAGLARQ